MRLGLAIAALVLAAAAPASASTIVYGCGHDICAVSPGGSHKRHITTDGTEKDPYHGPRLTARILSFNHSGENYLADRSGGHRRVLPYRHDLFGFPVAPLLRPDGRRALFYQGLQIGSHSDYRLCDITIKRRARAHCPELLPAERASWIWGPGHKFLSTAAFNGQEFTGDDICITAGRGFCRKPYFKLRDGRIFEHAPALAPNQRWLAAGLDDTYHERRAHHIALIDLRRRRLVRDLTGGPGDAYPSWSPDGRRIVFVRTAYPKPEHPVSSICTASIRGGHVHCPVKKVKGDTLSSPTWG